MRRADGNFPEVPPSMDFRPLSRNADKVETVISLFTDHTQTPWIKLGEITLRRHGGSNFPGVWSLGAYLLNATDFEHDSAHLLKLELVSVELTAIDYGYTRIDGYIRADAEDTFRVGGPDYNPIAHPHTTTCKGSPKACRRGDGKRHPIIPEGFYVPPVNVELFNIVRGRRVEIVTGPVRPEEED